MSWSIRGLLKVIQEPDILKKLSNESLQRSFSHTTLKKNSFPTSQFLGKEISHQQKYYIKSRSLHGELLSLLLKQRENDHGVEPDPHLGLVIKLK